MSLQKTSLLGGGGRRRHSDLAKTWKIVYLWLRKVVLFNTYSILMSTAIKHFKCFYPDFQIDRLLDITRDLSIMMCAICHVTCNAIYGWVERYVVCMHNSCGSDRFVVVVSQYVCLILSFSKYCRSDVALMGIYAIQTWNKSRVCPGWVDLSLLPP